MNSPTEVSAAAANVHTPDPPESNPSGRRRDPWKLQEAVVALGRRAIAPPDAAILMQDAAALLAEMLDADACGVGELLPDGESLRRRLTLDEGDASEPRTLVEETGAAGSDSLAGYALQVAHPVIVADLPQEERFTDRFLRKHGIRSAVAVPLRLQDRSFGSLAAYSRHDQHFADEDALFAETVAHLVATTIARRATEKSLGDQRRLAAGVLQTVDALVLVLDAECQIVHANAACERITGFSLAEIKGRPVWNVFPVPEEVVAFQQQLEKLRKTMSPLEYESYVLTKHSQRRKITWSYRALAGGSGTLESIIATGVDITQQFEAEERARRAQQTAQETRQAMARLLDEAAKTASGNVRPAAEQPPEAFGPLPTPSHVERRKRPRRSYPYTQKIAPVFDGKPPNPDDFVEVQCHDIGAGGFSFLAPTPPPSDTLVVALGIPPKLTHLMAQIAHANRIQRDGKRMFLIGCQYIGRAAYSG